MADLIFDSAEQAPEAIRGALAEKDGKFVFRYESPDKVAEFRETNIKLKQEHEKLLAQFKQFEGIDPEKAREASKRLQELDDSKLIESGKLDELVNQRVERDRHKIRSEYEPKLKETTTRLAAFEQENATLRAELESRDLSAEIAKAAGEKKIKSNKLAYLNTMARHGDPSGIRWTRKDGRMVAVKGDEEQEISFSDWIDGLIKADPDLVIPSTGGGAIGSTGGAGNRSGKDTSSLSPRQRIHAAFAS